MTPPATTAALPRPAAAVPLTTMPVGAVATLHEVTDVASRPVLRSLGLTDECVLRLCQAGDPCIVQARVTATVAARVMAPVRAVRVAPGDRVRAGQVLVELDGRDLTAVAASAAAGASEAREGAAAASAEERAAQAALVLARATHGRIAALQAKKSATAQELDEATAALAAAEAVQQADARHAAARVDVTVAAATLSRALGKR